MNDPLRRSVTEVSSGKRAANVLVVEDVVLVRMLICEYLRDAGFTIVEATSGDEAMAILDTSLEIDAVFADLYMPNSSIDGIGLAQWIRANKPDVKVVLTSGVADMADKARQVAPEGALIDKPYNRAQVLQRLREVLGLEPTTSP
jgi:two-component system, response regulator PdtaR